MSFLSLRWPHHLVLDSAFKSSLSFAHVGVSQNYGYGYVLQIDAGVAAAPGVRLLGGQD